MHILAVPCDANGNSAGGGHFLFGRSDHTVYASVHTHACARVYASDCGVSGVCYHRALRAIDDDAAHAADDARQHMNVLLFTCLTSPTRRIATRVRTHLRSSPNTSRTSPLHARHSNIASNVHTHALTSVCRCCHFNGSPAMPTIKLASSSSSSQTHTLGQETRNGIATCTPADDVEPTTALARGTAARDCRNSLLP
jgi:hypothetical protein